MDLKVYYKKVREVIETISSEFAVVVSRETPDGGKPGVMSEAHKTVAARLIVEGRAHLATPEECAEFRRREGERRANEQEEASRSRVQVTVLSERDIDALRAARSGKSPAAK